MAEQKIVVICKCVACGTKREVRAGEIPADEVPMCPTCYSPMVAETATLADDRRLDG